MASSVQEHEPAWLTAKVDQRIAEVREHLAGLANADLFDVIMIQLTELDDTATAWQRQHWEFACDNCREFHPRDLRCSRYEKVIGDQTFVVCFGACPACWDAP